MKLLLHICCGPCAIMPTLRLQDKGSEIIAWFMNPNIQPLAEYLRRREAAAEYAERTGVEIIFADDAWDLGAWLAVQLPRQTSPTRCHWCCNSRLEAAWEKARDLKIDYFSTSLLYSKYQPHEVIAKRGAELSQSEGARFVYQDFREDWQAGIDKSKEWGLYRQPYCGCVFSETERYAKKFARLTGTKLPIMRNH